MFLNDCQFFLNDTLITFIDLSTANPLPRAKLTMEQNMHTCRLNPNISIMKYRFIQQRNMIQRALIFTFIHPKMMVDQAIIIV